MPYALGIDLGGTKILGGLIDTDTGEVVSTAIQPTRAEHGPDNVLQRMIAVAEDTMERVGVKYRDVVAIGVGAAGQVDTERGMIIRAPNLPDALTRLPLTKELQDRLGKPVRLVNDVEAAAAGEASFGAGRGYPDFVCIFVGTGIGGAVYENSKPYRGPSNTAGELGHMIVDIGGRLCGCGGRGHLEAYASRTAIIRSVLGALRLGRDSVLAEMEPDPNPDDPAHSGIGHRELATAVHAGDALSIEMVEEAAKYMAAGLVSIINFYNPPRIILGGGVVGGIDLYFQLTEQFARQQALLLPRQHVQIVRAAMGENPGIIGAAVLALENR
ncbi:MAG: ROK family protein [Chloroflexota bacterium]